MFRIIVFIAIVIHITSCDFTSKLHKEILIAQNYIATRNYQKAVNQYEKILESNPPDQIKVKIKYQLGELYLSHLSDSSRALYYFKRIKERSVDPLWLVKTEEKIGEINFTYQKNYFESIDSYKKLSDFTPKLTKLDFYEYRLGLSYWKSSDLDNALEVFTNIKSSSNHEYYAKSFFYLGMIHFEKKLWKKAINIWSKYLKFEPRKDNIVQTKFLMANAYEMTEELKKAYNLYYSILGEYPNTDVIQNRLNSVYERRVARKR